MEKIKKIIANHKEIISYILVGIATTIVSWTACFLAKFVLDSTDQIQNFIINTIGWVAGVCFSYPLNRKWVFKSVNESILKEFTGFALSRVSTWILDVVIMWLAVNIFPMDGLWRKVFDSFGRAYTPEMISSVNYWVAKIVISSVLVTILNYIFGKYLVFKRKD